MLRTVITCFIVLYSFQGFSQSNLTVKYWQYKDRLQHDFMLTGTDPGMSSPAAYRNEVDREMKWADHTIYLGWYIATLATEYHLLNDQSFTDFDLGDEFRVNKNLNEIYLALRCINRLDLKAETAFEDSCGQNLPVINGFFIRDDVPKDFHLLLKDIDISLSDNTATDPFDKEMSQDQAYHILLGLALVKKYVPQGTIVNNLDIRSAAVNQALLILQWIHDDWTIRNPICFNGSGNPKEVKRGASTFAFAVGISKMMEFFSEGSSNFNSDIIGIQKNLWNSLSNIDNPSFSSDDNLHMLMCIAAISNGFDASTFSVLQDLSKMNDWPIYPLIQENIFGIDHSFDNYYRRKDLLERTQKMLVKAPSNGTASPQPAVDENLWGADNKFLRDLITQKEGKQNTENRLYNGLDYTLLHNIYWISNQSKWFSPTQSVVSVDDLNLKVYPNPVSDRLLYLQFNKDLRSEIKIVLSDLYGKLIYEAIESFSGDTCPFILPEIRDGVYLITVTIDKKEFSQRIHLQRTSF